MPPTLQSTFALLVVVALAACARMEPESRRFELTGTVAGHESSSARQVIAHDAVDGLMPAMSMPFEIRGAPDMFRALQMSGRGPDGYPLDVHPAKLPLPPQDPIWTKGAASALSDRAALLAHARTICGVPISREITPELRRALALKPRPEDFI